ALIRERRDAGHMVFLASASNERYVRAIADHLGVFDGWFGSSDTENLRSETKAARLVEVFGKGGFDYIGNDRADLAVSSVAGSRIGIRAWAGVKADLKQMDPNALLLDSNRAHFIEWVRLLRLHQWAKNTLVFVPLMTAHRFDLTDFGAAIAAFVAFSLI